MTDATATAIRLDPIMTIDGAFFWKAATEGRFVAQKCGGCARLWHPPRALCPNCHSAEKGEQELSGLGKVISWTMPIHPPAFGFAAPPIVVLVEVDEGLRFISNLEGVAAQDVRLGMRVKVGFAATMGGKQVPIFHPVEDN